MLFPAISCKPNINLEFTGPKYLLCEFVCNLNNQFKGLDEELAQAVNEAFYESYKTWKMDHPNASTGLQVIIKDVCGRRFSLTYHMARWFHHSQS